MHIDDDDRSVNPSTMTPIRTMIEERISRRDLLRLAGGVVAASLLPGQAWAEDPATSRTAFTPLQWSQVDRVLVPDGYRFQTLAPWGDPLTATAPAFDPRAQSGTAQAQQFGYNHDFIGYIPIAGSSEHGLLCISHEYTSAPMMHADWNGVHTPEQVAIEMAAHGMTVVAIRRGDDGAWVTDTADPRNRRITATTPITITGPAAGAEWMRTAADPTGTMVLGTINNCAGGITDWGTWLQAEENFHGYFAVGGRVAKDPKLIRGWQRYGVRERSYYNWNSVDKRFDLAQEPNEAHRFGWVVELDPNDPTATPRKRTALGRFKHEAATTRRTGDDRVAVYMGDDQAFEYIYKFVSDGVIKPGGAAANDELLDHGTLYVAKFYKNGAGTWMPLVFGQGKLTPGNGFSSQADVLIRTREAADMVGATPMDRPEDVEASPTTGKVYVALTNNAGRKPEQTNEANPRGPNLHGHLIEITEQDDDAAALTFTWEVLVTAGPVGETGVDYGGHADASPFSCPDNLAFTPEGELLVATDGQIKTVNANDGIYHVPVTGPERGRARQLLSGIPGGEVCGPCVTPDGKTLFCAIQHPGTDNPGRRTSFADPGSRFPDYRDDMPPRSAVVVVERDDRGPIL